MRGPVEAPPGPSGRHRVRRRVVVVALAVVGAWAFWSASTVDAAARDLTAAREAVTNARRHVDGGDLAAARSELEVAHIRAGEAVQALDRPHVRPLRALPFVGDDLEVVGSVATSMTGAADAGGRLLGVLVDRASAPGEQRLPLALMADLERPLRELGGHLQDGVRWLEPVDPGGLLRPVAEARALVLEQAGLAEAALTAADVVEVLPDMAGRSGPRRYLVAAGAYSELRGSGGLLGSWAVATVENGHFAFTPFRDVEDLPVPSDPGVSPSPAFEARYGPLGSLREWRNMNMTPDFPTAARVLMDSWEALGREPLDGVVTMGPAVVEGLVRHLGPLPVDDITTLRAATVRDYLSLHAYSEFDDQAERKRVLGGATQAAFGGLVASLSSPDLDRTLALFADLLGEGHLRVHARDPEVQQVLERSGVAGQLPRATGEFVAVVVNNLAANKVDHFTSRALLHEVRVARDGRTRSRIMVTFDNDAPSQGHPRRVLGPWTPHTEAGDNLSLVSLYCGPTCDLDPATPGIVEGGHEQDLPIWDVTLLVPSNTRRSVTFSTVTTDGWAFDEDGAIVLSVQHLVQPTLRPAKVDLVVHVPEGWRPDGLPDGGSSGDGVVRVSADRPGLHQVVVRLVPDGPS